MTSSPPLWKASAAVAKEVAADIAALIELTPPRPQAVLIVEDPFSPQGAVEALYDIIPDAGFLSRLTGHEVSVAPLPDQDWIRLSQQGLPPVRAGRFFVYGAHDAGEVPPGVIPIRIEAGLAFGTGHHETTALCLTALTDIARNDRRPRAILDLGCGTGVLAIAATKLWHCHVLATDIDAVAVEVARENARANESAPLVHAAVADGFTHPAIRSAAPFDLICANILAGPLCRLAPDLSAALARGGTAVLSGLLRDQEKAVLSFYRPHGLVLRRIYRDGPWSALVLERP
ncbi:MAG TPA: 50S ribosomal protein L11 methyltransferase [Micropepsaceae bacterium]|jgi:ribosomal protein L11 methyltransferase|nr:50S ribosomal protein L11 methyltransferase [Micropepsaceae bacterium]